MKGILMEKRIDLSELYKNDELFLTALKKLTKEIKKYSFYEGHLFDSAEKLYEFLEYDTNLSKADGYWHLNYHVENGHFVCMADERFDGESAAHIIWQAAHDYRINPRVLIVLLQKEQGGIWFLLLIRHLIDYVRNMRQKEK